MNDSIPQRVRRERTKGYKLPPNTKCVTRPGRFGNPFLVGADGANGKDEAFRCTTAAEAVSEFEAIVIRDSHLRALIRAELRGFNLACYCKLDEPCHADVLLRIANE